MTLRVFKIEQTRQALALGARLQRAEVPWCCAMQSFVHRKNPENYRMFLAGEALSDAERVLVMKLLAEEKAREAPPLRTADDD